MPSQADTPLTTTYRPELDVSRELNVADAAYYQSLIGILRWIVELGRVDVCLEVSMIADDSFTGNDPNGQLDPYIIKLIVQSPNVSLGKECKTFMNCLLVNRFWLSMFGNDSNSPDQPSTVATNIWTLFTSLQINYHI